MLQVQGDISRCECSAAGVEASLCHTTKAGGALCEYLQYMQSCWWLHSFLQEAHGTEEAPNILHVELQCPQVLFTKVTALAAVLWL